MLRPGTVFRVFDRAIDPKKIKRHICIVPDRRLTLRINSQNLWQPSHLLRLDKNPGLVDADSYVELRQLCRVAPAEMQAATKRTDHPLGRLSRDEANALAWSASRAPTLSDELRRLVWANLVDGWMD